MKLTPAKGQASERLVCIIGVCEVDQGKSEEKGEVFARAKAEFQGDRQMKMYPSTTDISRQILRRPMAVSGMMMGLLTSDLRSCNLTTNSGCSMSPVVAVRVSMVIDANVSDME